MSSILAVSDAGRAAMVRGWAELHLDDGPGDPQLLIFTSARPGTPGAPVPGVPELTIYLDKPSGALVGNRWRLKMKEASGYQATGNGAPLWGRLLTASGAWAADGDAGGPTDDVVFKLNSSALYAGGYVTIGTVEIG